jgi:ABC-type transport system involved in multi-copper enzyme maturation permease subunit
MLQSAQRFSTAPRAEGSTLTQTWRLVGWELFLARRRALSKVLAIIYLIGFALVVAFIILSYAVASSRGAPDGVLQPVRNLLTFPQVLQIGGIYTGSLGPWIIAILSGALIGSEYGYSTQRLSLARGVGRGQLLTAQVVALGLMALGVTVLSLTLSTLVGVTIGPAIGGTIMGPAAGGWQEIGTFILVQALILFMSSLLAHFFATLGRSVAAGIGISLGWLLAEGVVALILRQIGTIPASVFQFLGHGPDWFLGVNGSALKIATSSSPINFAVTENPITAVGISGQHALFVLVAYSVVFVGLSYWLLRTRDVTD